MQQAMNTLRAFSEKERAYHAYQARQNYLRIQHGNQQRVDELQSEVEQALAAKEQAFSAKEQEPVAKEQECTAKEQTRAAKEQERMAKMEALAEVERLKNLLDRQ